MKTILTLFFCCSLFSAQNTFKNYIPPEHSYDANKIDSLKDGKFIMVNIDGKKQRFLFDTGAPRSVKFAKSDDKNIAENSSTKSAIGEKVNMKVLRIEEFTSDIVHQKYKIIYSVPDESENFSCLSQVMNGILGIDFYFDSKIPILLDYKSNTIKLIENFNKKKYPDYYEVDVKFKGLLFKSIFIEILVNGKKEKFLFDTGASDASLYMQMPSRSIKPDTVFESLIYTASGIKTSEMSIVKDNNVSMIDFSGIKSDIIYLKELPNNLMGLSFIKNFNWIIDKKAGKMYFKPISGKQFISQIISRKPIIVASYQNKLKIIFLKKQEAASKYKIGDEIVSINNQTINPQNICEMQKLLNTTENWDKLNIQIKN